VAASGLTKVPLAPRPVASASAGANIVIPLEEDEMIEI